MISTDGATDPRVGSARDNSTSPGLSRVIAGSNSSSGRNLLATLIPVLLWAIICLIIFIILRRKCPRVYAPRSFLKSLEPQYVIQSCWRCEVDDMPQRKECPASKWMVQLVW